MNDKDLRNMFDEEETEIEAKGFIFLPSYMESYEILKNSADEEVADMLLKAIVYYGIKGEELNVDYRVAVVMASIKKTIDKGKENYKKRTERARKKEKEKEMAENRARSLPYLR